MYINYNNMSNELEHQRGGKLHGNKNDALAFNTLDKLPENDKTTQLFSNIIIISTFSKNS